MSDDRLILIRRFFNPVEAHIAKKILEDHDIHSFILDEHHSSSAWHLSIAIGGLRLMVLTSDYEEAQNVLNENLQKTAPEKDTKAPFIRKPYWKTLIGTIIGFWVGAPSIWRSKRK